MAPITENESIEPSGIELPAQHDSFLIAYDDLILLTGAIGFIGSRVIERLLDLGFRNVRCLVRPSSDVSKLKAICDAYCFAKVKQDEIVGEYGELSGRPYVIVRPGAVYGAGNEAISARIGIDTFGVFLHLGGSNIIPLTYVDNCADAIVLAALTPGIDGEVFNVVDDQLPSSRQFLRLYQKRVKRFTSIYLPHFASYALCSFWECYANWSNEQLPPVFNRRRWSANWKRTRYTNQKLKTRVGWSPRISTPEGMERYFEACRRNGAQHA
jgi:nucleoside-diphosphate-sugar epimerase